VNHFSSFERLVADLTIIFYIAIRNIVGEKCTEEHLQKIVKEEIQAALHQNSDRHS